MTQIIINHADGSKTPLFSKKNISGVSKATQKIALLSEDVVSIAITTATPLDLMIGDTTLIYGKKYKLNQLPQITKNGERNYTYELTLEGAQYDLIDVQYHLPEDCYGDTFYSDLGGHLEVLMWNISRVYPGLWKLGNYPKDTEYTNFTATERNCLAALQEHCTNYGVEFEITSDGKTNTLNIKAKAGITHTFTLKYGRGRGLYQLSRTNVNNAGITNRLFIYGGTENLGKNYGHTKLCLPGTTRLTSYLEDAESIAAYGIKENEKNYTNIKPGRIGTVTALGTDKITFIDNTMFDLNAKEADGKTTKYLIKGTNAKIKFESGQLAGYEFDLHSYEHGTHKFVINKFQDENGTVFPSETSGAFQISVGDKYSILDIQLPQEYITEAENDLKEAGTKDFETMTQPQVSYKLALTEGFFISLWGKEVETEILHVGDFIPIEDEQIGVNKAVRITRIERDLLKRHSYDITLSDTVTKSTTVRVLNEIEDLNEVITINKLADPARARRRWLATQELLNMVFDPEGDYYSEKIKPLSIETQMLSVGAKSTQFTLKNITFQPNYGGNPNSLYVSSGTLVHYAIDPDALKLWRLSSATFTNLTSATAYYIYAKCPKNGDSGTIVLSATAKTVEAEAGYYNFLVGVLNSVVTDANGKNPGRLVSLTYGSSTINGRFIRTGRIESSSGGKCYFDLDNDEIGGVIRFVSSDGTIKNVTDIEQMASEAMEAAETTNDAVSELSTYVDGAFADGIITKAEAKAIEKYINTVNNTKAAVEAAYNKLYTNPYLSGTAKTGLLNAKVTLIGNIQNLISAINSAIADGETTVAEKNNVDSKFASFNSAYADFNAAVEAANKAIQDTLKSYSDSLDYLKEAFKDEVTEINGGVVLSGFVGVRDEDENVVAAMSGLNPTEESDYPMFFAGATQGSVRFYGWTNQNLDAVYTKTDTLSEGLEVYNKAGDVVGTATSIGGNQIFVLSTTLDVYQRNGTKDFTATIPSVMEANRANFRVYRDGRCISRVFETEGSYKTKYVRTYCPPLTYTTVLEFSSNCYLSVFSNGQFGVFLLQDEEYDGYNCSIYNSCRFPCTVSKGAHGQTTNVGVLPPGEIMDFVNIGGAWILKSFSLYVAK